MKGHGKTIAHKAESYWLFHNKATVTIKDWMIWSSFVLTAVLDIIRIVIPYAIDINLVFTEILFFFNISSSVYTWLTSLIPNLVGSSLYAFLVTGGWFLDIFIIGGSLYMAKVFCPYRTVHRDLFGDSSRKPTVSTKAEVRNVQLSIQEAELEEKLERLYKSFSIATESSKFVIQEKINDLLAIKNNLKFPLNKRDRDFLENKSKEARKALGDITFDRFLNGMVILFILLMFLAREGYL